MTLWVKRNVYREDCSCSTAMVAGDGDVRAIRDWLVKQRHLPQALGKYQLPLYLYCAEAQVPLRDWTDTSFH